MWGQERRAQGGVSNVSVSWSLLNAKVPLGLVLALEFASLTSVCHVDGGSQEPQWKTLSWFPGPGMCKHHSVSEATSDTAQLVTALLGAQRGAQRVPPESVLADILVRFLLPPGKDCTAGVCCVRKQGTVQLCGLC